MLHFLNNVLWVAVSAYAVFSAYRLGSRLVAIYETREAAPDPLERPAIPADLVLRATLEGEEWARDQTLDAMRESYEKLGTWDAVRVQFGIAPPQSS